MPSRGVLFSLLALVIINTKMVRSAHGLPTPPATPPHSTIRVDSRCAQLGVSCLQVVAAADTRVCIAVTAAICVLRV